MNAVLTLPMLVVLAIASRGAVAQAVATVDQGSDRPSSDSGQILYESRQMPYLVRHLPVSSFPDLPGNVAQMLNQRGCTIPQTYEAHQPENVVHGSFERPGSSDWAVLCSVHGTVSLLVFFASDAAGTDARSNVLASAPEAQRLQAYPGSATLGFNWGIDPAPPQKIHAAQNGMTDRPAMLDHDALVDSIIDRSTTYHFFARNAWTVLPMPE